jgi:hypothetical protein
MTDITKMSDEQLDREIRSAFWDNARGDMVDSSTVGGWAGAFRRVSRYVRTLIPAAAGPVARWGTAMTDHDGTRTVVCNDGTVWVFDDSAQDAMAWRPLPSVPQPGDAAPASAETGTYGVWEAGTDPVAATKPNALMDALLAAVMDCGHLLSGIVAREDDASAGAHLPEKAEHLRLLKMCEDALNVARKDGWT